MRLSAVYVIAAQRGLVKVGLSSDPNRRLADLQTSAPARLTLVHVENVPARLALKVERAAHAALKASWSHREWFKASAADAVSAVKSAAETVLRAPEEIGRGFTVDSQKARRAIAFLSAGYGRPSDVARLAKVSPQVVNYWIKVVGLDWREARRRRIAELLEQAKSEIRNRKALKENP